MVDQQEKGELLLKSSVLLKKFSAEWHSDEKLRARIEGGDFAPFFEAMDADMPEGIQLRIVADTDQVQHLALPADPTKRLRDSEMQDISGGSSLGSASSVGSAGCFLCITAPSTFGTAGTAGTAGSASAGDGT